MSQPIERKLRTEFCPYVVTAHHLNQWRPYRIYAAYSYLGEVFVLLAGFGLANPVMAFLSGGQSNTAPTSGSNSSAIMDFLLSSSLGWLSLLLLLVWGLVKFYVRREGLEKRCSLITSYMRQCLQIEFALRNALSKANPMPDLISLQAKLSDLVDRNIAEGSIPGLGIDKSLQPEIEAYCKQLVADFSGNWDPIPEAERRA